MISRHCLLSKIAFLTLVTAAGCGKPVPGGGGGDDADVVDEPDTGGRFLPDAGTKPADAATGISPDTAVTVKMDAGDAGSTTGAKDGSTDVPVTAGAGKCLPPSNLFAPIEKLSDTGCMDPADLRKMNPKAIPYDVVSPLWSDAADKQRGFLLPAGAKIHVKDCVKEAAACKGLADDGKWVFPLNTVLIKNFLFDNKLVETRLFMRVADDNVDCIGSPCWVGYGYKWNEAQTEATVVGHDDRPKVKFNTGMRMVDWAYPNRGDCMLCHAITAGSTLGPETMQMNRPGPDGMNQIDKYTKLGLFDGPVIKKAALPVPFPGQPGLPVDPVLDRRARSYMHANCGYCHRPDGVFPKIDMRFGTALKDMNICNVEPNKGDLGVAGSLLVKPTKPMESVVWLRMLTLDDAGRMPQIGTAVRDMSALMLLSDWITTTVKTCPAP